MNNAATKTRFTKSYVFDCLDREMADLENKYGWQRWHVGTAEIERTRTKENAYDLGRYLALTDLFDHLQFEFGS